MGELDKYLSSETHVYYEFLALEISAFKELRSVSEDEEESGLVGD